MQHNISKCARWKWKRSAEIFVNLARNCLVTISPNRCGRFSFVRVGRANARRGEFSLSCTMQEAIEASGCLSGYHCEWDRKSTRATSVSTRSSLWKRTRQGNILSRPIERLVSVDPDHLSVGNTNMLGVKKYIIGTFHNHTAMVLLRWRYRPHISRSKTPTKLRHGASTLWQKSRSENSPLEFCCGGTQWKGQRTRSCIIQI